jgi:hypothetical protein
MRTERGIVLNTSGRVAHRLTFEHFPYGLPIMPGLSLNLPDALPIDTMSRSNVVILIHCDHPSQPPATHKSCSIRVTRRHLGVGDFSALIPLSGG